jgi:hypothetical protein
LCGHDSFFEGCNFGGLAGYNFDKACGCYDLAGGNFIRISARRCIPCSLCGYVYFFKDCHLGGFPAGR